METETPHQTLFLDLAPERVKAGGEENQDFAARGAGLGVCKLGWTFTVVFALVLRRGGAAEDVLARPLIEGSLGLLRVAGLVRVASPLDGVADKALLATLGA